MSIFVWILDIFTPVQQSWSWSYLVGIPSGVGERRGWGGGKINPETPCKFRTPVCPFGPVSSSILYPFCCQCVPKSTTNISVHNLWNELIMQTSRHPAIPPWCVYPGQTPRHHWGGRDVGRMHEETQPSWVTLYRHRDGVQTPGCTHTQLPRTLIPAVSTRIKKRVWNSEATLLLFPRICKGWAGCEALPWATRAQRFLCVLNRDDIAWKKGGGENKRAAILKSPSTMSQNPHVKHDTWMTWWYWKSANNFLSPELPLPPSSWQCCFLELYI